MKTVLTSLVLAAALVAGCGGGPQKGGTIRVGILNTARIVENDPAYKSLQLNIMSEKTSFLEGLPENPEELTVDQRGKFRQDSQKKQAEWQKKVMAFIQQSVKQITSITAEVAKQRDLDMVVINTPFTNAVHYTSGQDITLDVMLKLNRASK